MLVLSRKIGESLVVPGCDLKLTVVKVSGQRVKLGIEAPREITVHRSEILQRDALQKVPADASQPTTTPGLPR